MADNVTIVRRIFEEAFNQGNVDVVDDLVDPDVIDHSRFKAPAPGAQGFKLRIAGLRQAFPDVHMAVENLFADGDMVAFTWTITGTQDGPLGGVAPTGKPVSVTGINIERVADGKSPSTGARRTTLACSSSSG
jgi:predicted ester cyclase